MWIKYSLLNIYQLLSLYTECPWEAHVLKALSTMQRLFEDETFEKWQGRENSDFFKWVDSLLYLQFNNLWDIVGPS